MIYFYLTIRVEHGLSRGPSGARVAIQGEVKDIYLE